MVIVRLAGVGARGRLHVALEQTPFEMPPYVPDAPLKCTRAVITQFTKEPPRRDVVMRVGKRLLGSLVEHPGVRTAVNSALAHPGGCPIYLHMESVAAAEYPWESLFDEGRQRFLALEPEWPIARLVSARQRRLDPYVAPPVRMMAILSALGIPARDEWRGIRNAIESSSLPVKLRLVLGEKRLYDELQAEKPDWVETAELKRQETVQHELDEFDPHLVHFFCHGTARPDPILELASTQGHDGGLTDVQVTPRMLKGVTPMAWLATLNCCSGASDEEGVRGLASGLVANADYPAAIGMREPITKADARVFSEAFYTNVFAKLAKVFGDGYPVEADWATPLCAARNALRNASKGGLGPEPAAMQHRKWTVPILCVPASPLTIHPVEIHPSRDDPKENAKKLGELNTYAGVLGGRVRTSPDGLAAIRRLIDETLAELKAPG
jgi:hypothetical protein